MKNEDHVMSDSDSPRSKKEKSKAINQPIEYEAYDSDEDMYDTMPELFTHELFMFLFDDPLKFSLRKEFDFTKDLTPADYQKMKNVNRNFLLELIDSLKTSKDATEDVTEEAYQFNSTETLKLDCSLQDPKIYQIYHNLL
jgi:hypothetical protein